MLRNIPSLISPELLKILDEMGHGDELVIGDANFPAASMASRLVRLDGHGLQNTLQAILGLIPLDDFITSPVTIMRAVGNDLVMPEAHAIIRNLVAEWDNRTYVVAAVDRYQFYQRARSAYAIVATGEPLHYACVILTKGVFPPDGSDGN